MGKTLSIYILLVGLICLSSARRHPLKAFFEHALDIPELPFGPKEQPQPKELDLMDGSCSSCKLTMKAVDSMFQSDTVVTKIEDQAIDICLKYLSYGEEVCNDMVRRMAPIIIEVVANSYLEANYFCVEIMEACETPTFTKYYADEYIQEMLATKPESIKDNNFINNLYQEMKKDPNPRKTLTAVLMSDIHLDYDQILTDLKPFGEFGSETSQPTMEAVLQYVKEDIQPDFLFWTGDNSKSNTWDNALEEVIFYTRNISDSIKKFGLDQVSTIYPIEGNHDVFPVNVEDYSEAGMNEAINGFKDTWQDWMSAEEFAVFEQYGYYSKPLTSISGETYNTKVIAMNTMACYFYNWYLIEDRYDPGDQLAFIESELAALEKEGGKAILIAHVPPNSECVHEWGARFRAITDRYQHVIRFSLYGHRHRVMYGIAKSFDDNKNVGLDFLTGSMAMQPSGDPSFSVIEIDEEFMVPVNFKVYVLDLVESNSKGSPVFKMQNDHLQMYGLEDVSPDSMYALSEKILNDEEVATLYLWNQYRQHGDSPSCDEECRRTWFCDTTTTEVYQYETCLKLKPDILGGAFFGIVMNLLVTPWVLQDE